MNDERFPEYSRFMYIYLPQLHCELATPYIVTVWFDNDPNGDIAEQFRDIMIDLYSVYMSGPTLQGVPGQTHKHSFGFRTQEALDSARRIIPFPEELQVRDNA